MADAMSAEKLRSKTVSDDHKKRASLNKQSSLPPSPNTQYFSPNDRRFSSQGRGRVSSPLKEFTKAKDKISTAFRRFDEQLQDSRDFLKKINSPEAENVSQVYQKVEGIKEVIARDHMKVVFFGRTSNGKSTVINALLHDRVLPTGIGHTTNCFCSVNGTGDSEGWLLLPNSDTRKSVDSIQELAHSLSSESVDSNNLVSVYWPNEKCLLLKEDVVLVDSPGIDMDPDIDKWISQHCLDADVFVLVSNAESTLMQSEKKFFYRVSELLSKPIIFILNNRWDMSEMDTDKEMVEKVKLQHMRFNTDFLVNELKVATSLTARDRAFFVSGKEALLIREARAKGRTTDGLGLANNWQQRLVEFDTFERKLKECLSNAAIHTKFEKHHEEGYRALIELQEIMKQAEEECLRKSNEVSLERDQLEEEETKVKEESVRLKLENPQKSKKAISELDTKMSALVIEVASELTSVINCYSEPFDVDSLRPYLDAVCSKLDESVLTRQTETFAQRVAETHKSTVENISGEYKTLLKLSSEEMERLVTPLSFSDLTLFPTCVTMCADFKPDLDFHFTMGLSSILGRFDFGMSSAKFLTTVSSNQYLLLGGALIGGYLISKILTWEVVLSVGAIFGALYGYERLTWTDSAKEKRFKDQLKGHLKEKTSENIKISKASYQRIVENDLQLLNAQFTEEVQKRNKLIHDKKTQAKEQAKLLTSYSHTASHLRNNLKIVACDFEKFHEEYLNRPEEPM